MKFSFRMIYQYIRKGVIYMIRPPKNPFSSFVWCLTVLTLAFWVNKYYPLHPKVKYYTLALTAYYGGMAWLELWNSERIPKSGSGQLTHVLVSFKRVELFDKYLRDHRIPSVTFPSPTLGFTCYKFVDEITARSCKIALENIIGK